MNMHRLYEKQMAQMGCNSFACYVEKLQDNGFFTRAGFILRASLDYTEHNKTIVKHHLVDGSVVVE